MREVSKWRIWGHRPLVQLHFPSCLCLCPSIPLFIPHILPRPVPYTSTLLTLKLGFVHGPSLYPPSSRHYLSASSLAANLPTSCESYFWERQNIKNRTTVWSINFTSGYIYPKEMKTRYQKDVCSSMLLTIANLSVRQQMGRWGKREYKHSGILFNQEKSGKSCYLQQGWTLRALC